jgi:hypothetical protein
LYPKSVATHACCYMHLTEYRKYVKKLWSEKCANYPSPTLRQVFKAWP